MQKQDLRFIRPEPKSQATHLVHHFFEECQSRFAYTPLFKHVAAQHKMMSPKEATQTAQVEAVSVGMSWREFDNLGKVVQDIECQQHQMDSL